jgi:hypothetical protein
MKPGTVFLFTGDPACGNFDDFFIGIGKATCEDYFDDIWTSEDYGDTHMPIADYTNIIELGVDTDWLELAKSKYPEYFV